MLASPSRESDRKCARDLSEIIASFIRLYKKTGDERVLERIESLQGLYEDIKRDIATKDYSKDDAFIHRVQALHKRAHDKIK